MVWTAETLKVVEAFPLRALRPFCSIFAGDLTNPSSFVVLQVVYPI